MNPIQYKEDFQKLKVLIILLLLTFFKVVKIIEYKFKNFNSIDNLYDLFHQVMKLNLNHLRILNTWLNNDEAN